MTTSYTYYASGLRESKTANGVTTKFIWDGENLVLEYRPDLWEYTHTYVYGADGLAYRRDANGDIYTYLTSYRGDVLLVMDEDQTRMAEYVFDAYGNLFNQYQAPGFSNNFGYRGEYHDPESGYIYLRMRYLDPTTGRFLTEDPVRDGLNWFSYCNGNPVEYVDPWGLFDYNDRISANKQYNQDVAVLQNELKWLGFYQGSVDGLFGQQTLDGVNAYKNYMGLGNTGADWGVVGLQTWTSLGLTYRTQADIDAGITIIIYGGIKQYKNVNAPLKKALYDVATVAEGKWRTDYPWLISQVNVGAPWDIKLEDKWNETIAENTYPGWGVKVYFDGTLMTPEELGNYTYGYIGAAMGLSWFELKNGSWAVAGFPISGSAVENETADQAMVKRGFDKYREGH